MAFDVTGLIELEKKLYGLETDISDIKKELLEIGGEETEKIWRNELKKNTMPNGTLKFYLRYRKGNLSKIWYKSRSTGEMYRRTLHTSVSSISNLTDIYPQGNVKRGRITTRNAVKAFVLNYGRSNMLPKNYLPEIEDKVSEKAIPEMQDAFNKFLRQRGLV